MRRVILWMVVAIVAISCQKEQKKGPIKIAAIGDSITFGAGIVNPDKNSYPVQLSALLDSCYEVQNFGVSGSTLLTSGDKPYVETDRFRAAMAYKPDIALINLGTNDSKIQNRVHINDFKRDYSALIDSIKAISPECRIILLTPIQAHTYPDTVRITPEVITHSIVPLVKDVAFDRSLEVIDLHPMFDKYEQHIMPDKIHPSSLGAAKMAFRVYEHLMQSSDQYRFKVDGGEEFAYHGYKGYRFLYKGKESIVVEPKTVAKGRPWLWRARFWGHEPQTDIALLERGFHIVYNDVADMFGSPKAVSQWEDFYSYLQEKGLSKKCAIEAMSRGGLIAYNFAVKNPDKVAVVYADAPVLDIKSWPITYGKSVVPQLLEAYGFESIEEAKEYKLNPIDQSKEIAGGGFKMLHVYGDSDTVVPASENSIPFIEAVKEAGGDIEGIAKEGVGHHPHSLKNPEAIVKAILIAMGYYLSPTTIPTQGAEYRSGAGWIEGSDWSSVAEEISTLAGNTTRELLLLGNSITQGFGADRELVTYKPGRAHMDSVISGRSWLSAGISGDRTQHLLYRIENGNYGRCNPKCVVITIGINNLGAGDSAKETAEGIIACVEATRREMKDAKIVLFGALPAQRYIESTVEIAEILSNHQWDSNTIYIDPHTTFAPDRKSIIKELYGGDMLHLSPEGYRVWSSEIARELEAI